MFLNIVLIVLISRWYITFRIFLFQGKKIQLSKKLLTNGICSCCSTRREKKKKRHKLVQLVYSQPIMTIDGLHAVLLILACSIYFTLYDVCSLGWDVAKKKDQYHVTPFSVMQGILIFKRTKTNHSSSKRMDEKSTPVESYNYDNLNFFFADWVLAEKKKKNSNLSSSSSSSSSSSQRLLNKKKISRIGSWYKK